MKRLAALPVLALICLGGAGCTPKEQHTASKRADYAVKTTASDVEKAAAKTTRVLDNVSVSGAIKKDILLSNQIDDSHSKINVDTTNYRVKLMGYVNSRHAANAAIMLAKKHAGGRKVISQLKIRKK